MRQKKMFVVVMILTVSWFVFIFYMSSQTAVSSGQMSKSVTKAAILTGEKVGVIKAGNLELALKRYDTIMRNTAHVGMYFILACVMFSASWLWGLNKKVSVILSFAVGIFIGIIDEINQMHFAGRNSGGVISDGIEDLFRDTLGICIALMLFVIVRVITELPRKNKKI